MKISIIIPVYNGEKYIKKCLDSLINQNYKNFEALIINDGSVDKTEEIINDFLYDKRFKLYNRKNYGIGASRNFGIKKSSGDYICFVDSDDYIEKDYLEKLYKKISNDNLDIVVCNYIEKNGNISKKVNIKEFNNTNIETNPELLLFINKSPWNKIYKTELIKNIKFSETLKYEDVEFILKSIKYAKIGYINDCLYNYVVHKSSETTTMDLRVFDILDIVKIIREYYKDASFKVKEYLDMMILQILTTYTIQQRYQKDKSIRESFINKAFKYIEENIPNYKSNEYFKKRKLRGIIEKNKTLTKFYCALYSKIK